MFSLTVNATSSTQTTVFGDTTRETTRSVTEIIVRSRHGSARIGPFYEAATSSYETPSIPAHVANTDVPLSESPLRPVDGRHTSPSQPLEKFNSLSLQSLNTPEKTPHVSDLPMQLRMKPQMPTMSALLRHDYHPRSSVTRTSLGVSSFPSSSAVKIEPRSTPPLTFITPDGKIRECSPLTPPPPEPVDIKDELSDDSRHKATFASEGTTHILPGGVYDATGPSEIEAGIGKEGKEIYPGVSWRGSPDSLS